MEKFTVTDNSKKRKGYIIPKFTNGMTNILPAVYERFSKEEVEDTIMNNYGIVTIICGLLDCTYRQFYNALDYYDLRDKLIEAKQAMVSLAESAVIDCLNSKRESIKLKAAEITLKSLGKSSGWNGDQTIINQQINMGDKEAEIKQIFGV